MNLRIASVYRSIASPYRAALKETFPSSLSFSARIVSSSGDSALAASGGGGEGGVDGDSVSGTSSAGGAEPLAEGASEVVGELLGESCLKENSEN